ncbi:UNVERIFIED_CONTAM: hypothetical protein K2H54_054232 [Gekko kuhli]
MCGAPGAVAVVVAERSILCRAGIGKVNLHMCVVCLFTWTQAVAAEVPPLPSSTGGGGEVVVASRPHWEVGICTPPRAQEHLELAPAALIQER